MTIRVENEIGTIDINSDVVATIAGGSAIECYGLVGMASRSTTNGIVNLLKRENLSKGVSIQMEEEGIAIDLYVIIQFGTKISVVAENIIEKSKVQCRKPNWFKSSEC